MFVKTLMVSTTLAASLLIFDVANPILTGAAAQAQSRMGGGGGGDRVSVEIPGDAGK